MDIVGSKRSVVYLSISSAAAALRALSSTTSVEDQNIAGITAADAQLDVVIAASGVASPVPLSVRSLCGSSVNDVVAATSFRSPVRLGPSALQVDRELDEEVVENGERDAFQMEKSMRRAYTNALKLKYFGLRFVANEMEDEYRRYLFASNPLLAPLLMSAEGIGAFGLSTMFYPARYVVPTIDEDRRGVEHGKIFWTYLIVLGCFCLVLSGMVYHYLSGNPIRASRAKDSASLESSKQWLQRRGVVHEACCVTIGVIAAALCLVWYPAGFVCHVRDEYLSAVLEKCGGGLPGIFFAVSSLFSFVPLCRPHIVISMICLFLAVSYAVRPLYGDAIDNISSVAVALAPSIVFLFLCTALVILHDKKKRTTFTQNILQHLDAEFNEELRQVLDGVIRPLLPLSVWERMIGISERQADILNIFDEAERTVVMCCELADFTRWSTTLLPIDVINTLAYLYGYFDVEASQCGVEKAKACGDRYICVAGLLPLSQDQLSLSAPASSPFYLCLRSGRRYQKDEVCRVRIPDTVRSLRFAYSQAAMLRNLNKRLQQLLGSEEVGFRIFVHCGAAVGSIMSGAHCVSYEVSGIAITEALLLSPTCKLNSICVSNQFQLSYEQQRRFFLDEVERCCPIDQVEHHSLAEAPPAVLHALRDEFVLKSFGAAFAVDDDVLPSPRFASSMNSATPIPCAPSLRRGDAAKLEILVVDVVTTMVDTTVGGHGLNPLAPRKNSGSTVVEDELSAPKSARDGISLNGASSESTVSANNVHTLRYRIIKGLVLRRGAVARQRSPAAVEIPVPNSIGSSKHRTPAVADESSALSDVQQSSGMFGRDGYFALLHTLRTSDALPLPSCCVNILNGPLQALADIIAEFYTPPFVDAHNERKYRDCYLRAHQYSRDIAFAIFAGITLLFLVESCVDVAFVTHHIRGHDIDPTIGVPPRLSVASSPAVYICVLLILVAGARALVGYLHLELLSLTTAGDLDAIALTMLCVASNVCLAYLPLNYINLNSEAIFFFHLLLSFLCIGTIGKIAAAALLHAATMLFVNGVANGWNDYFHPIPFGNSAVTGIFSVVIAALSREKFEQSRYLASCLDTGLALASSEEIQLQEALYRMLLPPAFLRTARDDVIRQLHSKRVPPPSAIFHSEICCISIRFDGLRGYQKGSKVERGDLGGGSLPSLPGMASGVRESSGHSIGDGSGGAQLSAAKPNYLALSTKAFENALSCCEALLNRIAEHYRRHFTGNDSNLRDSNPFFYRVSIVGDVVLLAGPIDNSIGSSEHEEHASHNNPRDDALGSPLPSPLGAADESSPNPSHDRSHPATEHLNSLIGLATMAEALVVLRESSLREDRILSSPRDASLDPGDLTPHDNMMPSFSPLHNPTRKSTTAGLVASSDEAKELRSALQLIGPVSAVGTTGAGYSALFSGGSAVSFHLLGETSRLVNALMTAAPAGFVGLTQSSILYLKQLFASSTVKGRCEHILSMYGGCTRWRIRGVGAVTLQPVDMGSKVPQDTAARKPDCS